MIFSFKNLGVIKSAEIEIKGLTVITGLNDTGKSFLGKTIFSIIKTINEAKGQQKIEQSEQIQQALNQAYVTLRQNNIFPIGKLLELNPTSTYNEIIRNIQSNAPTSVIISLVEAYRDRLLQGMSESLPAATNITILKSRLTTLFNGLLREITEEGDNENIFKRFFDVLIIHKLFQSQINTLGELSSILQIAVEEGGSEILRIEVENNTTNVFVVRDIINYNDATLVETPIILQLSRFINTSLAFSSPSLNSRLIRQRSELPYHYYDLVEKIFAAGNIAPSSEAKMIALNDEISTIIKGQVKFDPNESNFVFLREEGQKVASFNMASGVKSFGLLQLLFNTNSINTESILIIDEPEVHLHPKWEIEYAKLIVRLSKAGITVIVSSHSPYFLKALAAYVKEEGTSDITKFYFGEKIEGKTTSEFRDVSENLEPIFKTLADPLYHLPS